MDHNNEWSPATSGSQTPTVPVGSGAFNVPWSTMMGMMGGAPPSPGGGGNMPMMGGAAPSGGNMPWGMMQQMMQQQQQMMQMLQMQQQQHQQQHQGPPGDAVYRPTMDFLTAASHTSTPLGTQYTVDELLSLDEMGIPDIGDPHTPVPAGRGAKKKKGKAKAVGQSSQPVGPDTPARRRWTEAEYIGVARGWLDVCDDPLVGDEQRVVNMWAKIRAKYKQYCPDGKDYSGEDVRKGWERLREAVGRFASLYANALRQLPSGRNEDDARREAENQFPVAGKYKEFHFWECYLLLKDSEKFRAGCDAGWPKKQRLNYSGAYSGSSGGSHDLPPDAEEFPSTPSFARRPRPVGKKRAQRAARGGSPQEVLSPALPSAPLEYTLHSHNKMRDQMLTCLREWRAATDPTEKNFLYSMLQSLQADMDMARARLGGSDGGADTGGGGSGSGGEE